MTAEPYPWLIGNNIEERLEVMAMLREEVESRPSTALTYRPPLEIKNQFWSDFIEGTLTKLGLWRMPDFYTHQPSYVLPERDDVYRYAEVITECECGTSIIHQDARYVDIKGLNEHEDCRIEWQREVEAELWRKRREILHSACENRVPLRIIAKRLGFKDKSSAYHAMDVMNINYADIKDRGKLNEWATYAYLRDEGHKLTDIADAFGVAHNTICGAVTRLEEKDVELEWRQGKEPAQTPDWLENRGGADD